jgi:capsid portal protein
MALIDELPEGAELHIEKLMEQVKDMSFERLRKFNRDEVIASHFVPPKMLYVSTPGQLGDANDSYNQMKFFKLVEIDPAQSRIERILNRIIKNDLGIKQWKIKFNELDVRSPKEISEEIWGDVESGIRSVDEGRSMRGLDEAGVTKRMDQLMANLNKIEKAVYNL